MQAINKEAVTGRCSVKKLFLKTYQNLQKNSCVEVYFLIKLQASGMQLYYKRDSAEVFPMNFVISLITLFL